jgi:hypothetical protein
VNERLNDPICEEAGRRIYESQQSRLGDQTCLAAKRPWRSPDVPEKFWDGYCADARAVMSFRTSDKDKTFLRLKSYVRPGNRTPPPASKQDDTQ